jgi:hypothetical protein
MLAFLMACSPRDFLTRRLAADLIAGSSAFSSPQSLSLRTGIVSNKDYFSPEYLLLQRRGWISSATANCPPEIAPPPCREIAFTPAGVDTFRGLMSPADEGKPEFSIPAARRVLVEITGVSKQGNAADVEFSWKWEALNEVGAALYAGDLRYRSVATFRDYDDGWRLIESAARSSQSFDDALKNAEPTQ